MFHFLRKVDNSPPLDTGDSPGPPDAAPGGAGAAILLSVHG